MGLRFILRVLFCASLLYVLCVVLACNVKKHSLQTQQSSFEQRATLVKKLAGRDSFALERQIFSEQVADLQDSGTVQVFSFSEPVTMAQIEAKTAPVSQMLTIQKREKQRRQIHTQTKEKQTQRQNIHIEDSAKLQRNFRQEQLLARSLRRSPALFWAVGIALFLAVIGLVAWKIRRFI